MNYIYVGAWLASEAQIFLEFTNSIDRKQGNTIIDISTFRLEKLVENKTCSLAITGIGDTGIYDTLGDIPEGHDAYNELNLFWCKGDDFKEGLAFHLISGEMVEITDLPIYADYKYFKYEWMKKVIVEKETKEEGCLIL